MPLHWADGVFETMLTSEPIHDEHRDRDDDQRLEQDAVVPTRCEKGRQRKADQAQQFRPCQQAFGWLVKVGRAWHLNRS